MLNLELLTHFVFSLIAEAENESPGLFSSHGLLIGAGIAVVLAVGAMYVGGYII